MVLRKSIVAILTVLVLSTTACVEVAKEMANWTETEDLETVESTMHLLEKDNVKIFLPKTFKKYSSVEYLNLLDSLITENKDLEIERARFRTIRNMEGNHYLYFDNSINATYSVNAIPYTPISRQDAKLILGMIRQNQEALSKEIDVDYHKITAKHNDNGKTQIFKAIFKIENKKKKQQAYQHVYFISSNQKTLMINLMAPFEVNFDPFLEKMIL